MSVTACFEPRAMCELYVQTRNLKTFTVSINRTNKKIYTRCSVKKKPLIFDYNSRISGRSGSRNEYSTISYNQLT